MLRALLESEYYLFDNDEVIGYIAEWIVSGRSKNSSKLLKELDLSPVGEGTTYENIALDALKESFATLSTVTKHGSVLTQGLATVISNSHFGRTCSTSIHSGSLGITNMGSGASWLR